MCDAWRRRYIMAPSDERIIGYKSIASVKEWGKSVYVQKILFVYMCVCVCIIHSPNQNVSMFYVSLLMIGNTSGLMPSMRSEGGTLMPCGMRTCPKSTVNASHQMPKWPISKTVRSPGSVSTMVFFSYRLNGFSRPFSSGMRRPFGDGRCPYPTQNFASAMNNRKPNSNQS